MTLVRPTAWARTDCAATQACDIEIYFYPADGTRPRDELNTAADAIRAALREGVTVQDVVLIPEERHFLRRRRRDAAGIMLRLAWIETAEETGEFMEEMVYG